MQHEEKRKFTYTAWPVHTFGVERRRSSRDGQVQPLFCLQECYHSLVFQSSTYSARLFSLMPSLVKENLIVFSIRSFQAIESIEIQTRRA